MSIDDDFVHEAREATRTLGDGLVRLERERDAALVAELFRHAHSLKGSCRTVGLGDAGDLAHAVEDLLSAVRAGRLRVTPTVVDDALDAVDTIETVIEAAARDEVHGADTAAVATRLRDTIERHRSDEPATTAEPAAPADDGDLDGLSPEVRAALDDASEFDDIDALLAETEESDDEPVEGWGLLGDDEAAEPTTAAPTDETSAEPADASSYFTSVRETTAPDDDIDALQADIDAVGFGAFDDDDDLTIDELLQGEAQPGMDPTDPEAETTNPFNFGEHREVGPAPTDLTALGAATPAVRPATWDHPTPGSDVPTPAPTRVPGTTPVIRRVPVDVGALGPADPAVERVADATASDSGIGLLPGPDDPAADDEPSPDIDDLLADVEADLDASTDPVGTEGITVTGDGAMPDLAGDLLDLDTDDIEAFGAGAAVPTIEESRLDASEYVAPAVADGRRRDAPSVPDEPLPVTPETADRLLTVAEELSLLQLRLERATEADDIEAIAAEVRQLGSLTNEYQRTVMDVRLVPVERAVGGLARTARDAARSLDRRVHLTTEGEDVRLDRSVVDRLRDPLRHLVRNAVAHGIEPAAEREAAGKPAEGNVTVTASRERDRVHLTVTDDGRGVDADAVREQAVEAGAITAEAADSLTRAETYELLFHPGLSTAETVTDASGRGVGMDVVARTVERLDGEVSVDSTPGAGTTVTLSLPVRVALSEVLFVRVGDERFGIPLRAVQGISAPTTTWVRDGIEVAEHDGFVAAAGETAPVVDLGQALSLTPETGRRFVWLREEAGGSVVRCDEVLDSREVVVRPYEDVLGSVPTVSGATTLGDGTAVNVLDVEALCG